MLSIILLLIGGSVIAYLSLQNTMLVTLSFLDYTVPHLPLYVIIIGSMLVGFLLSYLIHLINSVFVFFTLHGKDKTIMSEKKEVAELTKRIHQLELENAKLSKAANSEEADERSL